MASRSEIDVLQTSAACGAGLSGAEIEKHRGQVPLKPLQDVLLELLGVEHSAGERGLVLEGLLARPAGRGRVLFRVDRVDSSLPLGLKQVV